MTSILLLLACTGAPKEPATTGAAVSGPMPAIAPAVAQDPNGVVATWEGGQLTYKELQSDVAGQLTKLEIEYLQNRYQLERQALDQKVIYKLLDAEAAKRGMNTDALIAAEVEAKVAKPTNAEVEEFYPLVRRQVRNAPLEEVRDQVEGALMMRRQSERMQAWIEELRAAYKVELNLPYPNLPRIDVSVDDDPVRGAAEATVTIIEFADYQCGYCRKIYPTLLELLDEYDGKVKLVYRDYPLGGPNPAGMAPSIAANCAGAQGKYWEMHHFLMTDGSFARPALDTAAAELKLDMGKFADCMDKPDAQVTEITHDFEDGQTAGVSGTPAFYINGVFLNGAVPKEQFKAIIDRELAGG